MDRYEHFTSLLMRHQEDLRAFVASVVRDWHAVDDILQETATVLWRKLDDYDQTRSFGAWARGIAALEIRKHFARSTRRPALLTQEALHALFSAWDVEEADIAHGEHLVALNRCLDGLPDHARSLLALRYGEELEISQVAARCGRGVEAVGKMLQRLRQSLGECVGRQVAAERVP